VPAAAPLNVGKVIKDNYSGISKCGHADTASVAVFQDHFDGCGPTDLGLAANEVYTLISMAGHFASILLR